MVTFAPGNHITESPFAEGNLDSVDGSLIDSDGYLIIDISGNTVSVGGGIDGGDEVANSPVTAGDISTAVVYSGNDITPVTWE